MLYHGSPYGKETIPIYELLAKKYGFEVQQIEVPHPGNEQQSQWLTIRRVQARLCGAARLGRDEPGGAEDGQARSASRSTISSAMSGPTPRKT